MKTRWHAYVELRIDFERKTSRKPSERYAKKKALNAITIRNWQSLKVMGIYRELDEEPCT